MDSYSLIEFLNKRNKKTVTRSELEKITGFFRAKELSECLELLLDEGMLSPMPKYGTNGNQIFPVFNKYHVRLPGKKQEDNEKVLEEIRKLHPLMIANNYLLQNPELYTEYKVPLFAVNEFLFRKQGKCQLVSRKERSFEIFGEEKFLEKSSNSRFTYLLNHMGIGKKELFFYDTPEYCFPDYIPFKRNHMTILICENKDIWFNIRRIMFENHRMTVFGRTLDGVLLGNGNQASEKEKLTEYTYFLGSRDVKYLYWGDIDREGFDIYQRVCKANPGLKIELFTAGYEKMLDLAQGRTLPDSQDKRVHSGYEQVTGCFESFYAEKLKKYLDENKRLPQEIISYAILTESQNYDQP